MGEMPDYYEFVWMFFICSYIGYGVEEIWCYLRHRYFESRKSLVYGHLSVIYGMGGVVLTLILYYFRESSPALVFLVSFVACTVLEYICSLGQEICFGSVAWDYSKRFLNIHGRVCLLYSLFWGILGIVWIKICFPFFCLLFGFINRDIIILGGFVGTVFIVYDGFVSAMAGAMRTRRSKQLPPRNRMERFFNRHFTDERMSKIYANSKNI